MDQIQGFIERLGVVRLAIFAGLIVSVALAVKLWNSANDSKGPSTTGTARCSCGWAGQDSLHRPVCPRCGKRPFHV
jgi:hypothetical protein